MAPLRDTVETVQSGLPEGVETPVPLRQGESPGSAYERLCGQALDQALTRVPFYQRWRPFDPDDRLPADSRYAAMPFLSKRDLRAHMPKGFVPRDRDLKAALETGELEIVSTSGTSEDRSSIVWYQSWWDRSEVAAAKLHRGLDQVIDGSQREAVLTTPVCAGNVCHVGDLSMSDRTLGRLLFLNQKPDPGYWRSDEMDRMIDELNRFRPDLLEADPAYLAVLARHAAAARLRVLRPRFISLTYELPSRLHIRSIRRLFGDTPVLSSYGSTETGHVFTECECGNFHQNTASCRVDFQPFIQGQGGPKTGRILVSILDNPWVSLLRFDVGDLVRLAERPCPCGRTAGLTVAAIEGRTRDLTFSVDGRAVTAGRLDASLAEVEGLLSYQIEQTGAAEYLFHYVADSGDAHSAACEAMARLHDLYGEGARISPRREIAIAAEPSGKFRLARTLFPWDPGRLFDGEGAKR